jgi:chemotaxis protein methyltransferase CheR
MPLSGQPNAIPVPEMVGPIVSRSASSQVTDPELARYADLIYRRTGIHVSPQKKPLLSNRLRRRLRKTGIRSFAEYYQHLKRLRPSDPEWNAFLQEVTTHETYLFRDEAQWDWFRNAFLRECAAQGPLAARRSLRIWSAACSTGDEPLTIACCIAACLPNCAQWRIRILATDIGVGALEQAQTGVFGERSMRLVPEDYRRRFFTKGRDGQIWQAKPALMDMIAFRQHNLMDALREAPFDLVFLKNVLIYFDAPSKEKVLNNVRSVIRPGGLLLAGAAEGVADLVKDFQRIQPWLYCRPPR